MIWRNSTIFLLSLCAIMLVTAASSSGRADEAQAAQSPQTSQSPAGPIVKLSGYFDGYYSYNFNQPQPVGATPPNSLVPNPTNQLRYYDTYANQITLSLAEATLDVKAGETEFLTDFDFGTFADLNAQSSTGTGGPLDTTTRNIGQAVLRYTPTHSRFSFEFGKMYSHLGLESAKPKDNDQYSRSSLFSYGIPFWHFGGRINYEIEPKVLTTTLCVYNGWNSIYDNNHSKTLGLQLKYTPNDNLSTSYNLVAGPEEANDDSHQRIVHEANAQIKLSSLWTLNVDGLFGSEDAAPINGVRKLDQWYGGLLGTRYQATEKFYVSPRIEIYWDDNGLTLPALPVTAVLDAQRITSATLTEGYKFTPNFETRLEERADWSTADSFLGGDGVHKNQATVLAAFLFTM